MEVLQARQLLSAVNLTLNSASAAENSGSLNFEITLDAPNDSPITLQYTTTGGSASTTDFGNGGGTITIPASTADPSEYPKVVAGITVSLVNDSLAEGTESFTVTITTITGANLANGTATGTITDDGDSDGDSDSDGEFGSYCQKLWMG